MGRVNLTVNGRSYEIACADGQEQQIEALGADLDRRIAGLVARLGQVGEARLLLLGGLLIANELEELRRSGADDEKGSALAAGSLDNAAERIDALAGRLEQA